jgi:hypothetical protein
LHIVGTKAYYEIDCLQTYQAPTNLFESEIHQV